MFQAQSFLMFSWLILCSAGCEALRVPRGRQTSTWLNINHLQSDPLARRQIFPVASGEICRCKLFRHLPECFSLTSIKFRCKGADENVIAWFAGWGEWTHASSCIEMNFGEV